MEKEASACGKVKRYTLTFSAKELFENPRCEIFDYRYTDNGLEYSEGCEKAYTKQSNYNRLFATKNAVYAQDKTQRILYNLTTNRTTCYDETVNAVLSVPLPDGIWEDLLVDNHHVYLIKDIGGLAVIGYGCGGTCAAVYGERIFTADKMRLHYNTPLRYDNWGEGKGLGGHFDLPAAGGDIVAMVAYKDKLWLFRAQGEVTMFRMTGDDLNAKVTSVPLNCGAIAANSPVVVGGKIYFLAERGLYAFNGAACELVDSRAENLHMNRDELHACAWHGRYYAACGDTRGFLYCYDPATKGMHTVRLNAVDVAANENGYILQGDRISRLTDEYAVPYYVPNLYMKDVMIAKDGLPKLVDGVLIEAADTVLFTLYSKSNKGCRIQVPCNVFQKIYPPVSGTNFTIMLEATRKENSSAIKSVMLYAREGRR